MAALSYADQKYLTKEQQNQILALKEQWEKANAAGNTAAMEAAHRQAEAIRATQNYSGGDDGSGYQTQKTGTVSGSSSGSPVRAYGGGQAAAEVQQWVDAYTHTNYDGRNGWVNGFSTDMNLRSMANYIRQQMQANSNAWAAADETGKAYLHEQNQQLAKILEQASGGTKSTYNEQLGRWETDNANLGYGYNTGAYDDLDWYRNQYGMTDEQIEQYRNDTDRYRNYVDQRIIRNWVDESNGYTGLYAQFVNGPYGQLLNGTKNVSRDTYIDLIGDGFGEDYAMPPVDANGVVIAQPPALKNNNSMTDYTRQFASYVDENGIIQPGLLLQTNPAGGRRGSAAAGHGVSVRAEGGGSGSAGSSGGLLDQWKEAAELQAVTVRDHAVDKAVAQLLQTQADANAKYQTQRDQIARDERNALDNSALYAETRGDRGGIGQAQYNQIQATAAANRQTVSNAQVQLAADVQRQMAQLRAEGEFGKADDLLQIAQTYLLKLLELEQWAAEYELSTEKFQTSVEQWQQEFWLKAAKSLL